MLRYALVALCVFHGVAHLVGFAVPWRLVSSPDVPFRTTIWSGRIDLGNSGIRLMGLGWLGLAIAFTVVAAGVLFRSAWWLGALEIVTLISVVFSLLSLPDARIGIPVNIAVLLLAFALVRFGSPPAIGNPLLETLWQKPAAVHPQASLGDIRRLPQPLRLYLGHATRDPQAFHSAVRLQMHGEIKLGSWLPFHAEEVINADGEFVWSAIVSVFGLPIVGSDRLLEDGGAMNWKLLGLIPVMQGSGPDVTRSAVGRVAGEILAWLPSGVLHEECRGDLAENPKSFADLTIFGETSRVNLNLDETGRLNEIQLLRWGNPGGSDYRYVNFGVIVEDERRFGDLVVPGRIRAGWFAGTPRFESEGEFFRATIDQATYR